MRRPRCRAGGSIRPLVLEQHISPAGAFLSALFTHDVRLFSFGRAKVLPASIAGARQCAIPITARYERIPQDQEEPTTLLMRLGK